MAFTRLDKDLNYISALDDLPNENNSMSASQLKAEFDKAGNDNKTALNGLMNELETVDSASFIGANPISGVDESDANVQAKLEKIYKDMQGMTQGAVPDNSITKEKLGTTLIDSLAFKNNELQTGLNAEKINGITLDEIKNLINFKIVAGTYTGNTTNTSTTQNINLGIAPKAVLIVGFYRSPSLVQDENAVAIVINNLGKILINGSNSSVESQITLTNTGFTLKGNTMNYKDKTYNYVALG